MDMQRKQSESDTVLIFETEPLSLTLAQVAWLADGFDMTPSQLAAKLLEESK